MFETFLNRLHTGLAVVSAVMGLVALLLSCNAIIGRYLFPRVALDWTSEVVVFLVIWSLLISLAGLTHRNAHIVVDLFILKFPKNTRRFASFFALILGFAVTAVLIWSGILVMEEAIRWGETTASTLQIPLWIYYLSLPVAFSTNFLFLIGRTVDFFKPNKAEENHAT
jgi:TRAP-type C4-dicarboxylate transport system permease small subunit